MTHTGKDAASFFENGTTEQFEYCYNMYPQVLKMKAEKRSKKPQELIRLDDWYQNKLPKVIKERGRNAHMEYEELVQTMKWKQARGKFYPQLSYLIKVNTPRAVVTETKKAFRKLPNLEQAITALSNLKGVGTTMASALLAAACPDSAPFMADECLMAIPEIEGIDYTTKEYLNFVQHMQATVKRLNSEAGGDKPFWSPHRVELALWAHQVANDLSPELLEKMPNRKGGSGANCDNVTKANGNGSVNAALTDGISDDTNDGDNSRAGRNMVHVGGVISESETENENTNPTPQDGDSNFVSNDSTSQEPIIDENTMQTIATTTTEDGEGYVDADVDADPDTGTPLASDCESNTESPIPTVAIMHSNNSRNNDCSKSNEIIENSSIIDTNANDTNGGANALALPVTAAGDNSSSVRQSEYDEEESSSNNIHAPRNYITRLTPLINHNDTSSIITTTETTESTLSGNSGATKRAHYCNHESIDSSSDNVTVQPDLKKRRSD